MPTPPFKSPSKAHPLKGRNQWERRDFLRLMTGSIPAAFISPLLTGCAEEDSVADKSPGVAPLPEFPFGAWKKMREAIRKSPDHLGFRAKEVVETKDPEAIFRFVRDNFITRPDRYRGGTDIDFRDRVNWGTPGLLRSGIGTPREKAELLHSLYTQAGFKAQILEGTMDIEAIGLDRLFFKKRLPDFAPDESIAPIKQWKDFRPISAGLKAINFEELGESALLKEIKSALGDNYQPEEPNWPHLLRNTSIVSVEIEGKEIHANPHIVDIPFGEHGLKKPPRIAGQQKPMATPVVKVTLSASTTSKPHERFPLVEGSWKAAELMGRQLRINFMPTEEPANLLRMRLGDLESFIPVLSVQSEGLGEDDVERMSFAGDLINIQGDQIKSEGDQILINNKPVAVSSGNPDNMEKISRMEVEAEAGNWPEVKLRARVLDEGGKTVPDLPGGCFQVIENNRAVPCQLLRNTPKPPRILFVFDYSGSMKPEFRGKGLAPLVREICTSAREKYGDVQIQLSVISYDTAGLRTFTPWLSDVDEAESHILKYNPGGLQTSNYWTALAEATNKDANMVVIFTDADGTEEGTLQQRTKVTGGCPAVVIGVPSEKTKEDHLASLAAASGGTHILANNHATAAEAVLARLSQEQNWPYLISYFSPITKPESSIKVRLQSADEKHQAETSYEVASESKARRSFAGIYLEISIGDQKSSRTLAGLAPWKSRQNPVTEEHAQQTRNALFGEFQLSFEGEAPTASAMLDNLLGSFLSLEPLLSSLPNGTEETIIKAMRKGAIRLPSQWMTLNSPLGNAITENTFTFQEGWRAVLFSSIPAEDGQIVDRSDVLSFTNWRTISKDPAKAWETSLAHSLRLSLIETANFDTSTGSALRGKKLQPLTPSQFSRKHTELQDESLKTQWMETVHHRESLAKNELALVAKDLGIEGYWSINMKTGSVLGFLPNGTGGGETSDTERYFDRVDSGLQAFDKVMGKLNLVSPAFAVWVQLEQIKVAKVKLATMLLLTMDGSVTIDDFENQLRGEARDWARDIALEQAGKFIGPIGDFNNLRDWSEMATGIGGFIAP